MSKKKKGAHARSFCRCGTTLSFLSLIHTRSFEWPWRGAPEYGEARAERNSIFARIWRNVIKCTTFSMIVLLRNQTVLCVILGILT